MQPSIEQRRSTGDPDGRDARAPRRTVGGYRLTRLLGRGGMAEVWLGEHEISRGLAAVKVLRPNAAKAIHAFFARERRTVLRLRHPNIVPIFDVGDDFIAAAYIDGTDLRHRMRSPVSPAEAVRIVLAVGSALATAHEQGVVHCDVKPANILIDSSGTPFLADFGIAQQVDAAAGEPVPGDSGDGGGASSEAAGVSLTDRTTDRGTPRAGTPAYMAPEQAAGQMPSPASDQYSLARTLLALLVGQRLPRRPQQALSLLPAELGSELKDVIARGMARSPAVRFNSVSDFADALRALELSDRRADDQTVPLVRGFRQFAWAKHPLRVKKFGESIYRADYSLSSLVEVGLLSAAAVERFRQRTGHADFTWSMYARDERLGPLTHPYALARAQETVVLLHGLFASREIWRDVAVGIARDNGLAVALAPDLLGFGESPFVAEAPLSVCTPDNMVSCTTDWLELIGLGRAPTVMLGHSISAAALMCAPASELGPEIARICVTPALPSTALWNRMATWLICVLGFVLALLPLRWARPVLRWIFRREPSLQSVSVSARDEYADAALRLGTRRVGRIFRWTDGACIAPSAELQCCTVVTTRDDPLVPEALALRTISRAGIPQERVFQLVYGGHFPQLVDDDHPEWGARNVHELVSVIDTVLDVTHAAAAPVAPTQQLVGAASSAGSPS